MALNCRNFFLAFLLKGTSLGRVYIYVSEVHLLGTVLSLQQFTCTRIHTYTEAHTNTHGHMGTGYTAMSWLVYCQHCVCLLGWHGRCVYLLGCWLYFSTGQGRGFLCLYCCLSYNQKSLHNGASGSRRAWEEWWTLKPLCCRSVLAATCRSNTGVQR